MTYTLFPVQTKKALEQRKIIYQYRNDNYWLSNFWPCAVVLPAERDLPAMTFTSVENAYMAWKTINQQVREQIQKMEPGDAKKETHKPEFVHRSPYTNDMRVEIMEKLVEQKIQHVQSGSFAKTARNRRRFTHRG